MPTVITAPAASTGSPPLIGPYTLLLGTTDGPTLLDDRVVIQTEWLKPGGEVSITGPLGFSKPLNGGTFWQVTLGEYEGVLPADSLVDHQQTEAIPQGTLLKVHATVIHSPYAGWTTETTYDDQYKYDQLGISWKYLSAIYHKGVSDPDVSSKLDSILAAVYRQFPEP